MGPKSAAGSLDKINDNVENKSTLFLTHSHFRFLLIKLLLCKHQEPGRTPYFLSTSSKSIGSRPWCERRRVRPTRTGKGPNAHFHRVAINFPIPIGLLMIHWHYFLSFVPGSANVLLFFYDLYFLFHKSLSICVDDDFRYTRNSCCSKYIHP